MKRILVNDLRANMRKTLEDVAFTGEVYIVVRRDGAQLATIIPMGLAVELHRMMLVHGYGDLAEAARALHKGVITHPLKIEKGDT